MTSGMARIDALTAFLEELRAEEPGSNGRQQNTDALAQALAQLQARQEANQQETSSVLPDRFPRNDAEYLKYYYANRNLNPRLPPPSMVSRGSPLIDPQPDPSTQNQPVEMDASQAAALSAILGVQQQIQEPAKPAQVDAYQNLRSQLRFASSHAVLGDVGSRHNSFTSGVTNNLWNSGTLNRQELTSNSASQVPQLEGLMQAFSPRTSYSNASVISAHAAAVSNNSHPGVLSLGVGEQDLGPATGGLLVDPLYGPGIASAGLSPRSSAASLQALLAEPAGGALCSPARTSSMTHSFTLGGSKDCKGQVLTHSGRSRAPSKLRVGSTAEYLQQAVEQNPGTPSRVPQVFAELVSPSVSTSQAADVNSDSGLQTSALAEVLAAVQHSTSGASQAQQQQLQQMYLAISGYGGVPQVPYGAAYAPVPGQAAAFTQPQPQYQTQQYGFQGVEVLGMGGGQPGVALSQAVQGTTYAPVSPAEYAAYYQQYMENQAAIAAAMGQLPAAAAASVEPLLVTGAAPLRPEPVLLSNHGHLLHSARPRSLGGIATPPLDRLRGSGYSHLRHSGELHGPGIMGLGRSENGADLSMSVAGHLERLQLPSSSSGAMGSRRNSRRDGEGAGMSRPSQLLDEFKANKTKKYELPDILGHMYEFSLDQHGSRFIQQKLETATPEELTMALTEVLPRATTLMTDVFGNYVIQKFFEHGSDAQRVKLADCLRGQVLQLSLQMYGCRVVQKALEVLPPDAQCAMIAELDGNVMRCVRDQNGNHVIQKIIECVPTNRITALLDNFLTCVVQLSSHPFGCRVMQRILEHCDDAQRRAIVMEEILKTAHPLSQDQYGNYVIQHVLEHGTQAEKQSVVTSLAPHVVQLSMHKFASNVIEKCLTHCTCAERDGLIKTILGPNAPSMSALGLGSVGGLSVGPGSAGGAPSGIVSTMGGLSLGGGRPHSSAGIASLGLDGSEGFSEGMMMEEDALTLMMKDQFGNYVVQRVLEVCDDLQRENLLQRVRAQLHHLKKFTYGKHIVARVEKLLSAGTKIQSHLRARPLPNDTASLHPLVSNRPASTTGASISAHSDLTQSAGPVLTPAGTPAAAAREVAPPATPGALAPASPAAPLS